MAEGPQGRGEVARLLDRHAVRPKRRLGQHFLVDPNLVRRVVDLVAAEEGTPVVEVGAGTGTLTRELARRGYRVRSYEVDRRLEPVLRDALGGLDVELRFEDALEADLPGTLEGGPWVLASNLPYHVGTPLVLDLLRRAPQIERFVVMVQREVADRFTASPGGRDYGLPTVVVRLHAEVDRALRVPPQVFLPPPPVESAVVVLERRTPPAGTDRALELAAAAFGQRRKMLRSSLAAQVEDPEGVLRRAGVDPRDRAEAVPPEGYLAIARAEEEVHPGGPERTDRTRRMGGSGRAGAAPPEDPDPGGPERTDRTRRMGGSGGAGPAPPEEK